MMRAILTGLFAVASFATLGLLPTACSSSGIGDPCTPEDEYNAQFSGFHVTEDNIESRSFQCESRICLVNHFQGRVSCPLGQPPPASCTGPNDGSCGAGKCTEAATYAPYCDTKEPAGSAPAGKTPCPAGFTCQILNTESNAQGNFCACDPGSATNSCPQTNGAFTCDAASKQCKTYVCHTDGDCQDPNLKPEANAGKACCIPGDQTKPIIGAVCGQCDSKQGGRDAANAVYCSCRCGLAEGEAAEPNFNFCTCPDGFECSEIRRDLGIGDPDLAGKYCIKNKTDTTASEASQKCGVVAGHYETGSSGGTGTSIKCDGSPSPNALN